MDNTQPSAPTLAAVVISGVAATGAPLDNAIVSIQEKTGKAEDRVGLPLMARFALRQSLPLHRLLW